MYPKNELILDADTNLGKLSVNLIIIGWVCLKIDESF